MVGIAGTRKDNKYTTLRSTKDMKLWYVLVDYVQKKTIQIAEVWRNLYCKDLQLSPSMFQRYNWLPYSVLTMASFDPKIHNEIPIGNSFACTVFYQTWHRRIMILFYQCNILNLFKNIQITSQLHCRICCF